MDGIGAFLEAQPFIALFLVISVGYALGKITTLLLGKRYLAVALTIILIDKHSLPGLSIFRVVAYFSRKRPASYHQALLARYGSRTQ